MYGHRNWVVVTGASYPAQSRFEIEAFALDLGQEVVAGQVLASLGAACYVRPLV